MFPANESETIMLYKLVQRRLGWHIARLQTAFPDAVIENRNGIKLVVEFEYQARNFEWHGHNPGECDLIICWCNDWLNAPLPVWALEDCAKEEARIVEELLNPVSRVVMDELRHYLKLMHRARLQLESSIVELRTEINRLELAD